MKTSAVRWKNRLALALASFRLPAQLRRELRRSAVFVVLNGQEVSILLLDRHDPRRSQFANSSADRLIEVLRSGGPQTCRVVDLRAKKGSFDSDDLLTRIRDQSPAIVVWLKSLDAPRKSAESGRNLLNAIQSNPDLIAFYATAYVASGLGPAEPFQSGVAPVVPFAEPRRRSVLFSEHCYYNFFYLAQALRKRGWDALSVSTESPDAGSAKFYHGQDLRIFDPDPVEHQRKVIAFLREAAGRFGIFHTYGLGVLSMIPANRDVNSRFDKIPWDILDLKRRGILIGYSHSGCLDAVSQSSFRAWSPTMCPNCAWFERPDICSDSRNLAWGRKVMSVVDLYCAETDPLLDIKNSPKTFRGPLTFAMDATLWRPDLAVPPAQIRARRDDEVVVYHGVGNYHLRLRNERNVKGTGAVVAAVETLQKEGIPIRLDFVHDVSSVDNRFVQVQADIIVDQLNYGRYGALAREGMMLGKPVVGRIVRQDGPETAATRCIADSPIVDADELTITDVLRDLALNPAKRAEIGRASREHAVHWWSADRLAERFERVYDHVRDVGRPPADEDVP